MSNTTTPAVTPASDLPWVIFKTPEGDWRGKHIAAHELSIPRETANGCVVIGRVADSNAAIREIFRLNDEARRSTT